MPLPRLHARGPTAPQILRDGAAVSWAARLGAELREPDRVSQFAIEGALLLLVADLSRLPVHGERRRPRWLQSVEDAIEHGGPVRADEVENRRAATYNGQIVGSTMIVSVQVIGVSATLGPFSLKRGGAGRLYRCYWLPAARPRNAASRHHQR